MKILLDECLPAKLRGHLSVHEVHTVEWAGFKGLENGTLLTTAEQAGYDVLVTADQGIPYQQEVSGRSIAILIVRTRTNSLNDLLPRVPIILATLSGIQPGSAVFL